MDFLLVFLAMELKSWRRWILLGAASFHALFRAVELVLPPLSGGSRIELSLLALTVVLLLLSWREKVAFRWGAICIAGAAGIMFSAYGVSRFWGLEYLYPLSNPVSALLFGDSRAFYTRLCAVAAAISTIWVVARFIRETLERRRQIQALAENHRLTQENYQIAEEKLRQNAAMRHEWKNQISALHLLQQMGDLAGLDRQLDQLDHQLDRLAPRQYSTNPVINTILQSTAARAEDLGVVFRAIAPVPPELGIETDDLCSLLLNLLGNALEAASQVPAPAAGEVECSVKVRQGYLAIRCENTYTGRLPVDEAGQLHTTKADRDSHGFGVAQMRTIAGKYGSMLDITYTEDRFIVQTALKIK